jgi:hypothetical protein
MSLTPPLSPMNPVKTKIIINNLNKLDFLSNQLENSIIVNSKLSLADQIKLIILNLTPREVDFPQSQVYDDDDNFFLHQIEYWSNLPFLNRIVIILKDEVVAQVLFDYLTKLLANTTHIQINLRENLLSRSKSFDNISEGLDVTKSLNNFKQSYTLNDDANNDTINYNEPTPQPSQNPIDLSPLDPPQQPFLKSPLARSRSYTKTLFKPELVIDTSLQPSIPSMNAQSPTITLDETF